MQRRRAFTLVEVLIAATILAGAAVALLVPFSHASAAQRLQTLRATASNLATQQMERLGTLSYGTLRERYAGGAAARPFRSVDESTMAGPGLDDFSLTIEAAEVAIPAGGASEEEAARFCRVVVTVDHADIEAVRLARLFAQE